MDNIGLIGIGNPFRSDDGVGWAVIDALEGKIPAPIQLHKSRGDIGELLQFFENYATLYLIDACIGDGPVGSWQRIDALQQPLLLEKTQTSTHGLSISQAISLAKTLNQLPSKLYLYAIHGQYYNINNTLSLPVAKAVTEVVKSLLKEEDVHLCMKKA